MKGASDMNGGMETLYVWIELGATHILCVNWRQALEHIDGWPGSVFIRPVMVDPSIKRTEVFVYLVPERMSA